MRLVVLVGVAVGVAVGALARGCPAGPDPAPASIVCPPQCELEVVPAGGERLRATCWCDRGGAARWSR